MLSGFAAVQQERIPRGQRNGKHGRVEFQLGGGTKLRAISEVIDHGQKQVADRYGFAVERNYDAVSQVQAMDMEGLDVGVLFRTSPLHCDDSFEAEYANDLCRAWNSWITDFCKENPSRLKASALITLHDVDLAIEEVRRVVNELEVTALSLCPEPVNGKRIHDRYYDPLWAEIEELGVALCFHPPARPKQDQVANKFFGHPNANIVAMALRNPVELILAVSSFCAGGVLEKFPNLRVAFLEGNCAWLPWLLYRLDERVQEEMVGAVPWYFDVVQGPIRMVDGHWQIPELPGLGIEVNEAECVRYPFQQEVIHTVNAVLGDGTIVDW